MVNTKYNLGNTFLNKIQKMNVNPMWFDTFLWQSLYSEDWGGTSPQMCKSQFLLLNTAGVMTWCGFVAS